MFNNNTIIIYLCLIKDKVCKQYQYKVEISASLLMGFNDVIKTPSYVCLHTQHPAMYTVTYSELECVLYLKTMFFICLLL